MQMSRLMASFRQKGWSYLSDAEVRCPRCRRRAERVLKGGEWDDE